MKSPAQLTQRRRPGRPQWSDLKDRVVDAGLRLLSRGEALTIRGLAREVGKTQQAIYIYYPGMDAVKAAIATRGFRRLAEQLQVSAAATPDARARLGVLIGAYIRFALQNRALFRLMFSGEIPAEFWTRETGEGDLLDARIATMGVVSQVIRQAQDADVVQAGPSLDRPARAAYS